MVSRNSTQPSWSMLKWTLLLILASAVFFVWFSGLASAEMRPMLDEPNLMPVEMIETATPIASVDTAPPKQTAITPPGEPKVVTTKAEPTDPPRAQSMAPQDRSQDL